MKNEFKFKQSKGISPGKCMCKAIYMLHLSVWYMGEMPPQLTTVETAKVARTAD